MVCWNYKNLQKAENLNRKQTLIRLRLYEVHAKIITMTKSQYRRIAMKKKKIVIALGHEALGTTLPEQKEATKRTAKAVADYIR